MHWLDTIANAAPWFIPPVAAAETLGSVVLTVASSRSGGR